LFWGYFGWKPITRWVKVKSYNGFCRSEIAKTLENWFENSKEIKKWIWEEIEEHKKEFPETDELEQLGSEIEAPIVLKGERSTFIAKASDGYPEHISGFYRRYGDKWIVAELTLLRGIEYVETKEGVKTFSTVKPFLIYNKNGERGYQSLEERVVEFDGRQIVLEGTTLKTSLKTLMGYETAVSFLEGRTEDLKIIYLELKRRIERFVNFEWDLRLYDLASCIVIATYFFDVFRAFPIIFVYGPLETGKARLVKTLIYASHKGLLWVSPTPAPIYRTIDAIRPSLGIDEFTKVYEELRQLTRAIYKKGLLVPRMERPRKGGRMFLTLFETYTPPILGATKELEPMAMSRAIIIHMRKADDPNPEKRAPEPWDFEDLRDRLYVCRLTKAYEIDELRRRLDRENIGLEGREYEVWRPILTIAKAIDEEVFSSLLGLAKELSKQKYEGLYTEEKDVLLAIANLFNLKTEETLENGKVLMFYPKQVSDKLFELKAEEYGYTGKFQDLENERRAEQFDAQEYREARRKFEKDYNPRRIGWILKRLGLKYKHITKGNQYTLTIEEFKDLAKRFKVDLGAEGL